MAETPISYEDIRDVIQKQCVECDEKYVLEKVFWQRCIKLGVTAIASLLSFAALIIGWNLTMGSDISAHTESIVNMKERVTNLEYVTRKITEKQDTVLINQKDVIVSSNKLSKKIDLLLKHSNIKE